MAASAYFLPPGYRENVQASSEVSGPAFWADEDTDELWQWPVYRLAARIVAREKIDSVLDVGCGTGAKLNRFLLGHDYPRRVVGVDQSSGIDIARRRFPKGEWLVGDLTSDEIWEQLSDIGPGLVIFSDVVEHLNDPTKILDRIGGVLVGSGGHMLISTPDRARLRVDQGGPPGNPLHVREWAADEFRHYLQAVGFTIIREWHLAARGCFGPTTVLRIAHGRLRHGPGLIGLRSSMAFRVSPSRPTGRSGFRS